MDTFIGLDTFSLSRMQFALNISFHILFPSITIALAWFLFFFKIKFQMTGDEVWLRIYRFWVKIFALSFALGVVSGITMSFQFGTNWPGFMETVGNIAGPLLGYEVLTAFFLEATFLGIMLFGLRKVPPWVHTLSTLLVAIGTTISAFWIIALNSWMHTPKGFEVRDGVVYPLSWLEIIFNPSMPFRFAHVLLASALTAAFLMAGISAYRLLKGDKKSAPEKTLRISIIAATIFVPLQIFVGDLHGLNTLEHQPAKIAAIEGVWQSRTGVPLLVFAIPDEQQRINRFEIGIPKLASFILTHDFNGEVKGLTDFEQHPPVKPVFFAFRIMVVTGISMLGLAFLTIYFLFIKKRRPAWLLKLLVAMTFSGWIATLSGWYVTEIGRQPFLVSNILTTEDAVTSIAPANVGFTLTLYLVIYSALLFAFIKTLFFMARKSIDVPEMEKIDGISYQEAYA